MTAKLHVWGTNKHDKNVRHWAVDYVMSFLELCLAHCHRYTWHINFLRYMYFPYVLIRREHFEAVQHYIIAMHIARKVRATRSFCSPRIIASVFVTQCRIFVGEKCIICTNRILQLRPSRSSWDIASRAAAT